MQAWRRLRSPSADPRQRLFTAIDLRKEGLPMAPALAIPRLLARHGFLS